jgi:ATP-dependent exoDNAse (exonuclease V) alpha subunit
VASPASSSDTLTGVLERIIFLNEENHYTIAEFRADAASDKITITGALPGAQCGETLHLRGQWTRHAQHGDQFKVESFTAELPSSVYGIRKYLGSGLVPGIGKVYANKIVDAFGTDTLRVLSEESGKLRLVPGIGKVRATAIKKAWDDQRALREIHIFLQTYGVTTSQCVKLVQRYGGEAKDILLKEPYRVAREIDGIGFKTADKIAINLGYANDAAPRLDAGLLFSMETLQEEGHTALREADLTDHATQLLETSADRVTARIAALVEQKNLVRHAPAGVANPLPGSALIQLPHNDRAEAKIAAAIVRLTRVASNLPPIKTDAALVWAEQKAGFAFADQQRAALRHALTSKVSILTGGPGTGKAQPLDALVLTPAGFKPIGTLKAGDTVIGADGQPTIVTGIHPQGPKEIFEVSFTDGRSARCCDDHLWRVWTRTSIWSPGKKKKVRSRGWRVLPLSKIRQRIDDDRAEAGRIAIPLAQPWTAAPATPLPCDAYVIGALIGDGCISASLVLTSTDAEIVDSVAAHIAPLGLQLKPVTLRGANTISYRIIARRRGLENPLTRFMRKLGLAVNSERKFIPEIFFNASHLQRLQLMRGLMDTDGTVDRLGVASFTTSSPTLARDFQRLAWSLGCIATFGAIKKPTYTYGGVKRHGLPAFTLFLQHPEPAQFFTLSRKKARLQTARPRKRLGLRLRIQNIQPAGTEECVCISLAAPDGLYVTDNYLVTHNTTILRALVEILRAKKVRIHLAAPTGRAAQRLAETTGGFASTIHRLLKYDPAKGGFSANESTPLATDFLVVDEASMLDTRLAASLFQAIPSRAHLLLVGDTDQLPSVGAGNILKDLIASAAAPTATVSRPLAENESTGERVGVRERERFNQATLHPLSSSSRPAPFSLHTSDLPLPVTRLDVIYRQKGQSQIVTTAHAINAGDPSLPPSTAELASVQPWSDLTFIIADSADDCLAKTIALCTEFIPRHYDWFDPRRDVQVLAPMHKGTAGVGNFNTQLQAALNARAKGLRAPSGEFRPGDKIIQLRNNYDKGLFNGDIGAVTAIDAEAGTLTADFDGEPHTFDRGELGSLALAYAISIHKSQGSEYPVVIVPLLKAHFMMLQRNLLYTAITRGKKKVFLVGEPAAYGMAVRNSESKLRSTHLREKIAALLAPPAGSRD